MKLQFLFLSMKFPFQGQGSRELKSMPPPSCARVLEEGNGVCWTLDSFMRNGNVFFGEYSYMRTAHTALPLLA